MRRIIFTILLVPLFVCFTACRKDPLREAKKIVKEWTGKTILIPADIPCTVLGEETVCPEFSAPYKILLYTDSAGCISCKLNLAEWQYIIEEAESLFPGQLDFAFYFQPKREKELIYLMKQDNFDYPVFIDRRHQFNELNHLPEKMEFQCFLLDHENRVQLIGNPSLNPQIWELFKQKISGASANVVPYTKVTVVTPQIETEDLQLSQKDSCIFVLHNSGNAPLIINAVRTTCGCIIPFWSKEPVLPGETAEILIEVTPDEPGFFHKTIDVYCNIPEKKVKLTVRGAVSR